MKTLFDALKIRRDEFEYFCNLIKASKELPISIEEDRKMSENYIVINGKKAELTEDQLRALGIEPIKNKRWRARKDDICRTYYYVSCDGRAYSAPELEDDTADFRYNSHNYFKTRDRAKQHAAVLETEMLLKKFADEYNDFDEYVHYEKFYLAYIEDSPISIYSASIRTGNARTIWFSTKEIAEQAIEEIGEDRIKEYLTYEW